MRTRNLTIWVMVMVCATFFSGLPEVSATIVYDFGGEYDIDFPVNDSVRVYNNANDEPTTVNLLPNGSVTWMDVWDTSQINIAGGLIGGSIFGQFFAHDDSIVTFSSGVVENAFEIMGNNQTTITGGSIGYNFQSNDYAQASISNTSIGYQVSIQDHSRISIDATTVDGIVESWHDSEVDILGGEMLDNVVARNNSSIDITGGNLHGIIDVYDDAVITLYGSNFNYSYGAITNSTGILTGTLANGNPINNRFYVHDNASIVLVPEPATLLLLGFGAAVLRRKRFVKGTAG